MRKESIISKGKYAVPQSDQLISVREYMFVRGKDGRKQLVLRLNNDRNEVCDGFSLTVYQYDAKGKLLGEEQFESEEKKTYKGGTPFVLEKIFKVKEKCTEVRVGILWASFGDYTYQVESTGINVIYEKGKETLAQMPDARRKGKRKVKKQILRKPWTFVLLGLLLLAVCFVSFLFMLRVYVNANNIFSLSGVQYEFVDPANKDGDVVVVGYKGVLGNMLIPAEIEGHKVIGIKEGAFVGNRLLRQVRIEGVDVPAGAFSSCRNLNKVQLVDVRSVEAEAFFDCDRLRTVESYNLGYLGENAFSECNMLESVLLTHDDKDSVLTLGNYVFAQCTDLKKVSIEQTILYPLELGIFRGDTNITELHLRNYHYTLPNQPPLVTQKGQLIELFGGKSLNSKTPPKLSVLSIDCMDEIVDEFCAGFPNLTSVTINESRVTKVGADAFAGDVMLSKFSVPGHITYVGERAFSGTALTYFDGNGLEVIADRAFENCASLVEIPIPLTGRLYSIGQNAFAGCVKLESINIPAGVQYLSEACFMGCTALKTVQFNEASPVDKIPASYFNGCSSLTGVYLPAAVEIIETEAFRDCAALASIVFPDALRTIGENAFDGCSSLSTISSFNNVSTIENYAFANSGLVTLTVPDTVEQIGFAVFSGCNSIRELTLPYLGSSAAAKFRKQLSYVFGAEKPDSEGIVPTSLIRFELTGAVSEIADYAFYDCKGLINIILPDEVTTIGNYAFAKCSSLTSFVLEGKNIGTYVFAESGLQTVTIPDAWTVVPEGSFASCALLGMVKLPEGLTTINADAFAKCTALSAVTLPQSLNTIGANAFSGAALASVTLPNQMTSIGENAFASCAALKTLYLPQAIQTIGVRAFENCTALQNLNFSMKMVGKLGEGAFAGCTGITNLTMAGATVQDFGSAVFAGCESLVSVEMPATLTGIPEKSFEGCSKLAEITLPDSLTEIGASAFAGCTSLPAIALDKCYILENIQASAFAGCTSLDGVALPDSLTEIGASAFAGCTSLDGVDLPDTLAKIGASAFADCTSLSAIVLPRSISTINTETFNGCTSLAAVTLNEGLEQILASAFQGVAITSLVMPETVTRIGESAFESCTKLSEITLKNGLKQIFKNAFQGAAITKLVVPETVESIGEAAFNGCNRLAEITLPFVGGSADGFNTKLGDIFGGANATVPASLKRVTIQKAGAHVHIKSNAFAQCDNLEEVLLDPDGKNASTSIQSGAFTGCDRLFFVSLPNSLTTLANDAFSECYRLYEVENLSNYDVAMVFTNALEIRNGKGDRSPVLPLDNGYRFACYNGEWYWIDYAQDATALKPPASFGAVESWHVPHYLFYRNSTIESVELPEGVTSIQLRAFEGCTALNSVTIAAVGTIEKFAFQSCQALNSVTITAVGTIEESAFQSCQKLNRVTIGDVGTIGESAFQSCQALNSATITKADTIGKFAFQSCTALNSVNIAEVTTIGEQAFAQCTALNSVNIAEVTTIGEQAFAYCSALKEISMSAGATQIGDNAFAGCSELTAVTLSSELASIGKNAFYNCKKLYDVYYGGTALGIAAGSKEHGYVARYAAYVHTDVNEGRSKVVELNGMTLVNFGDEWLLISYTGNVQSLNLSELSYSGTAIKSLRIRESVFAGNTALKTLTLGAAVKQIQAGAFAGCSSLSYVDASTATLTEIEDSTFANCALLWRVDMPSLLQQIGTKAFFGCKKLLSITIPFKVSSIGENVFSGCDHLYEVYDFSDSVNVADYVDSKAKIFTSANDKLDREEVNGCMFVKIGGVWYLYHYKGEATDQLTIELSEAFEIWPNAFVGAEIKAVRLDSNVTKIHGNAFAGVSGLSTFYYEGTDVAFANVLQGTSLSGNKYYQYYNGCVHGTKPNQWGDHGNGIFYTPCALEWFEEVKATCESEGLKVERCACGCDYKSGKTELIPKKAHEFVDGVCDCGLVKEQLTDENLEQWQTAGVIALDGFAVEGGKFSATNLGDEGNSTVATFTITAKQDMKVTFAYAVHSEVNGDKLIVDVNGEKFEVSGDDGKSLEFVLEADQTITFTYQKKESASVEGECACVQDIYFIYYNN